jgi:hypothetical protein
VYRSVVRRDRIVDLSCSMLAIASMEERHFDDALTARLMNVSGRAFPDTGSRPRRQQRHFVDA